MISTQVCKIFIFSVFVSSSHEQNQDDKNPNILVPTIMLKNELNNRQIEFSDWENEWIGIDNFYCRSLVEDCEGCSDKCSLLCQNYELTLSISINSWNDCSYPYGFDNDTRLSSEQQAIIAIIFLLAIIFALSSYYIIRNMTNDSSNYKKNDTVKIDKSDNSNSTSIALKTFDIPHSFLVDEKTEPRLHTAVPYEKFNDSLEIVEDSKNDQSPKNQNQDGKNIYTPVILSVK